MTNAKKVHVPVTQNGVDEICRGMMYASLAITDDKKDTLKKVGKVMPWHIEALRLVTGSKEQAHKTLTEIMNQDMGLHLDCIIDINGITKGGHFLDTQGFIAHNSEVIVLSYRCTTTAFDWLTNLNTTSSAWEIEEDQAQGYSGMCSGFEGFCCNDGTYRPRVHTGFYNNFLASLPLIEQHIEPLLGPHQPPRKLFVVGHSLGAGIATLAGCYFLTEFDWTEMPQRLVNVTAGSPRACCASMKTMIDKRREEMGSRARIYRVVKGKDCVVNVPPKSFGFRHLVDPVRITDAGEIVRYSTEVEVEADIADLTTKVAGSRQLVQDFEGDDTPSKYERTIVRIPKALRDHMPDFYLKPLLKARGVKHGSLRECVSTYSFQEPPVGTIDQSEKLTSGEKGKSLPRKEPKGIRLPKMFRKKQIQDVPATYF
jgi:predicted lipase